MENSDPDAAATANLLPEMAKLQVPMKKSLYDALKTRADELGFDSVQSYVRLWATAETAGHWPRPLEDTRIRPTAGPRAWAPLPAPENPQPAATAPANGRPLDHPDAQALRYIELLLATNKVEPASLESALDYVHRQLGRAKGIRYLDKLLYKRPPKKSGLRFD